MVLAMSRPVKHRKTGVYWFRKRVPADIAALTRRKEAIRTLGTKDPEEAKRKYAEVLAEFEREWARIRLRGAFDGGDDADREIAAEVNGHPPRLITDREAHHFAKAVHDEWIAKFHDNPSEQLYWRTDLYEGMWTKYPLPSSDPLPGVEGIADAVPGRMPSENLLWKSMRSGCISRAKEILSDNDFSDDPWSIDKTARAVASALQRASLTLQRFARGDFEIDARLSPSAHPSAVVVNPAHKLLGNAASNVVSLTGLVESWWQESKAAGRKPSTYDSYRNAFAYLRQFLRHDDASKVTTKDVIAFKDHRLRTPSPKTGKMVSAKTVKDSNLSALKVVFDWGVVNGLLSHNPATGVTLKVAKPARTRSKGFSNDEAKAILSAALAHDRGQESWKTFQAKRWIPWLSAFTGARVGELAQLRKQDVFQRDDTWIIHITPEAGTVKTNEARDVPLHQQLVDLGFPTFVEQSGGGHLFLNVDPPEDSRGARRGLKNRLAEFGRSFVPDPRVAPNHGWRHRFKTIGMEAGIPPRILDAIQGQAPRTVAETYGEVTLKTMVSEIAKLPFYSV